MTDIRWKQRYENFKRALTLLSEALGGPLERLNQLEQEGTIQRFEYTFELAWKTLKDKLQFEGVEISTISPRSVVRTAFQYKFLHSPDIWFKMIDSRNIMSHTYDFEKFAEILKTVQNDFLPALKSWDEILQHDL